MATVTGLTAERMEEIEAASVVDGDVNGSGHLILTKHDGSTIDTGSVIGPVGPSYTLAPTLGRLQIPTLPSTLRQYSLGGLMEFPWGGYYKDEVNVVHLSGLLMTTSAFSMGSTIFTLPAGFRPAYTLRFNVMCGVSLGTILVRPSGAVVLGGLISAPTSGSTYPANYFICFDGISFPAEDISTPPTWVSLTSRLVNGWTGVGTVGGDTYAPVRGWLDPVGDVHIQGVVKNVSTALTNILSGLPSSLWTADSAGISGYIAAGSEHTKYLRLDVNLGALGGGAISLGGTQNSTNANAVSLDNIVLASAKTPANWQTYTVFANSWVNYTGGFSPLQIYRNPIGRVYIRGLIRFGAPAVSIGLTFDGAKWIEPTGHHLIPAWSSLGAARIDVIAGGSTPGRIQVLNYYDGGSNDFVQLGNANWDTIPR